MVRRLALLTLVVLAGCSSTSSVAEDATWNAADIEFVQGMIPHHEQAVVMADMVAATSRGEVSEEITLLAAAIRSAQQPEIDQMQALLAAWGEQSHSEMGHSPQHEGMMSDDEMGSLDGAMGGDFERLWYTMMIRHHEGAITMAQKVIAEGKAPQVRSLAEAIIAGQTAEISQMTGLLGQ